MLSMFFGTTGGTIGETSALAILLGAAYLLIKKVITWRIPVIYIVTTVLFTGIFHKNGFAPEFMAAQVCGGGLLLGAFFMANDFTTSPITVWGQVIYAVILGILTGVFRTYGASAEGVSYAIILCNLLVPLIEKITIPRSFGKAGAKHGNK